MSVSSLNDDWVKCRAPKELQSDIFTWTTSISRSRVSTVDGLGFSENVDVESMNSLESLLHTVQQLKLKRLRADDLEDIRFVAAGETFAVSECKYEGTVVAIKRIRLNEEGKIFERSYFQRRLQSILREVLIMCHPPLVHHPNIIDILGYGWSVESQRPSPFISVEFASKGTLREYMRDKVRPIRTKLVLMGDVGTGIMALHKCGIVHGDLKMDNIVVFSSLDRPCMSIAKVSDFGHSIIVGSASEKRKQYFGTTLYNAPEVAEQNEQPIPIEQLHKCDIWAFGLCAWEILADGQLYFQRSWRKNPLYERSSSQSTSLTSATGSEARDEITIDEDDQHVFGRFDLSYLKALAIEFVNSMDIPGIGFEKGFLRPLMDRTLQVDPARRISDLSRLPIIVSWHKTPGGHSLQSKLATYAISGDIRYSIFSRDTGPYIIWEQQQQLLQDFEAVAQRPQAEKDDSSMAFQTMLCYVNAFGTTQNLTKATLFLQMAEGAGNLIARILGARMLDGFSNESIAERRKYNECLALGFRIIRQPGPLSTIVAHSGESVTKFISYADFREAFIEERREAGKNSQDKILQAFVTLDASSLQYNLLEIAIQHGDLDFIESLLTSLSAQLDVDSKPETLLVQAASRGHGSIVISLLKAGVKVASRKSASSLLHWLFCLDDTTLHEVQQLLQDQSRSSDILPALDNATTEKVILHPQWPFQIHGSPLATAIASGSLSAVRTLLALGANPLAPAFATIEDNIPHNLTPIHLAVQYHLSDILLLLWEAAFGEKKVMGTPAYLIASIGPFPVACALSLLTNAERFAIHGGKYKQELRKMIQFFPGDIFLQASPDGRNAITQAIDLEDVDSVELLLEHCPILASRELVQADNNTMFTYPFHFAVQIGSCRDTKESEQILEYILQLDPTAIDRPDSASVKPLHIAAMGSSDRMTRFLLDRNASCHDLDGRGRSPLHFCRALVNAKTLILKGVDINHRDHMGLTAAHAAAAQGADEVLKALIDVGADLKLADNEGGLPLHCAIQRKSRTTIEMLLAAGVDVNATNSRGQTSLHLAMAVGRSDLVSLLFEQGADPFIEDKYGSSPFSMSLTWENPSIFTMFRLPQTFDIRDIHVNALIFAAGKGEPAVFRQYLSRLPNPSRELDRVPLYLQQRYVTAINTAAAACRVDVVDLLLAHGFKVDTPDLHKSTPLLRACQAGRLNSDFNPYNRTYMCEKLLGSGANILAKDTKGLTPFLVAQAHADYPLMTLFLDHVLSLNDIDVSARRSRILQSIKSPGRDEEFCRASRALIGDEFIEPSILADAVNQDEWEFIMTCIGGHFVGKQDLRAVIPNKLWTSRPGVDSLDMLRYHSVRMDREMVQYLQSGLHKLSIAPGWGSKYVGRRNIELDLRESRGSLNEILWPEEMKKLMSQFMARSDPEYIHASKALSELRERVEGFCEKLEEYVLSILGIAKERERTMLFIDILRLKVRGSNLTPLDQLATGERLQTLRGHLKREQDLCLDPERFNVWNELQEQARLVGELKEMADGVHQRALNISKYLTGTSDGDSENYGIEQQATDGAGLGKDRTDQASFDSDNEDPIERSAKALFISNQEIIDFRRDILSRYSRKPPDVHSDLF
ncbi:uncharacterized protein N7482_010298 [Penicillium canariense]|uniref:Protein kinase domain-containing protein n=1 Tax=Penicillium canariense TaxID=189055 RepID=A0A9W9HK90_9EURO|nr:uncharacterized protein N7482_010298 [Penicillium canariense]KAJ5151046.1 hypothetical protein N7482_010298 [Penicillium canariense]